MLPIKRKHSFLVTGFRALIKSTNAVYMNNISTYSIYKNMDIYFFTLRKGIALFKEKNLALCIVLPVTFFKTRVNMDFEFKHTFPQYPDVNTMIL